MTAEKKPADDAAREETLTQAERIRVAMAEKGYTQTKLAKEAGISQGNLSRYLKGVVNPGADILDRIYKVLGQTHSLAAVDGALGIQARAEGKLIPVDIMAEPIPVDWIASMTNERGITGFVARGFLTMIAGEPGAGKSMTTQTLAEALVTGKSSAFGFALHHRYVDPPEVCPFGTAEECEARDDAKPTEANADHIAAWHRPRVDSRVLVLDAENAPNIIQERAQNMGLTDAESSRYMAFASDGFDFYRDRKVLDATLAAQRDAGEPVDLIVLDSFTSLWMGNENVVEQVSGVLKYLNGLAARFNVAVLLIHHTDKEGENYRGSSAIAATIGGGVFTFTRIDEKEGEDPSARRLTCRKMRIAAEPLPHKVYLTSRGIDIEPETAADRVTLAVAEQARRAADDERKRCNCLHPSHGGKPCTQYAADDTGRCLRCFQESH